jgi:arylsulfatase A-like enzyme
LPQELSTHNYQTAIFSNQPTVKYIDTSNYFQELFLDQGTLEHRATITDYSLTNNIQAWLEEKGTSAPFFLYIHYWGCHVPYRPLAPYKDMFSRDRYSKKHKAVPISTLNTGDKMFDGKGRIPYVLAENNITDMYYYIAQYDGVISYVDSQIGRLMDTLKRLKLDNDTMCILISDHGEMLGEHNMYFFHTGGYEENIRVPLIIRFPELFPGGKKVSTQVSLIDIAPTIFEIIGLTKPSYMQGESLLSFVKPFRSYNAKYALSSDREIFTVRRGDWKLIYNSINHSYKLFDLKNVPKEENNLMYQRLDVVKLLARKMGVWRDKKNSSDLKGRRLLLENDKEILRSLGYFN